MKKVLLTLSLSIVASMGSFAQNEPYKNPKLAPEERAEDLIGRLTLKEKSRIDEKLFFCGRTARGCSL